MISNEETFDFVFSLGGNCISALQLRQRELRTCSLPFDWLFHIDNTLLRALNNCFKEDFNNWLQFENMQELKGDERGTSPHYQYKDNYTGYRFIHDFHKPIENSNEFKRVQDQYIKRIKRLYSLIEKSNSILILLNAKWKINTDLVERLHQTLIDKWPGKNFKIVILNFGQFTDEKVVINPYCSLYRFVRNENSYDYFQTNYEWEFLDRIKLKKTNHFIKRYINIKRIGHGWQLQILCQKRNLFGVRVRLFGFILDFSIGKVI